MTTPYAGNDEFPIEVDLPDDGVEDREASSVDVPFEGTLDRTKYLRNRLLPIPALNWRGQVPTNFNQTRAVYSDIEQTWYIVGDDPGTDQFERLQDIDDITGFEDLSAALGGGALAVYDIACRQSLGDLVMVAKASRDVYVGVLAGYGSLDNGANWTKKANALAVGPTTAAIDWDDINDTYITVYRDGVLGFHVEWWDGVSPTFTPATTIPAAWTGYTGTNNAEIKCSVGQATGRALACFFDATAVSHRLNVMHSTDGGDTWTNVQEVSGIGDYVKVSTPGYNKEANRWYVAGSSSAPRTEIWESTDGGVTFSSVGVVSGFACEGLVVLGELMVLLGNDQRIAYSIDRGVTWRFCRRLLPATTTVMHLRGGGGGFLFTNNVTRKAWSSARIGMVGEVL